MSRPKAWLAIAVVAYLVAWFVPVIEDGTTLGEGGLPGWEAFRVALEPVLPSDGPGTDSVWRAALSVLSALSNFFFLWAAVTLLRGRRMPLRWLSTALFAAAILNTHWFVLNSERGQLRPGYYLWMLSFWLLAFAARSPSPSPQAAAQG